MKEKLAENLLAIKEQVSAADRRVACEKYGLSYATVHNYLNGKVGDIDTGITLLRYFREVIQTKTKMI